MSKAVTFKDLGFELSNYSYTKEAYEFAKECYELDLMAKYFESTEFFAEYADEIKTDYAPYTESFFIEAESKDEAKKEYDKKSTSVFKKFLNGIKNLWNGFKNFFKRLFDPNSKTNREIKATIEELDKIVDKDLKFTPDDIKELNEIIDDCWMRKYCDEGYDISFNNACKVADVVDNLCDRISDSNLSKKIKAAFTLDSIIIHVSKSKIKKNNKVAYAGKIIDLYDVFFDAVRVRTKKDENGNEVQYIDTYSIYRGCKRIKAGLEKIAETSVFSVPVEDKKLETQINKLEWTDYGRTDYDLGDDRTAIIFSDINKVYEDMNEILGNTITLYGYIARYRNVTHRAISHYINKCIAKQNKSSDE